MTYDANCPQHGTMEIEKPMAAPLPACPKCGQPLTRAFTTPAAVHFHAGGFYSADVQRLKGMIGPERFARFEKQKTSAQARAHAGTLTDYERMLEE